MMQAITPILQVKPMTPSQQYLNLLCHMLVSETDPGSSQTETDIKKGVLLQVLAQVAD